MMDRITIMEIYTRDGAVVERNNNNIVQSNITTVPNEGRFNDDAISFNGSSSYIRCLDPLDIGQDDFTISLWFKPIGLSQPYACIISFSPTAEAEDWYNVAQGHLWVNQAGTIYIQSGINYTASPYSNIWNHYAFVKSSGSLSCYFNGTKIGSNSCTGHISTICIGGNDVDSGGGYYMCYLDNFVISDTARYTDTFTPPESPVGAYCNLMYLKDKEVWGMKE